MNELLFPWGRNARVFFLAVDFKNISPDFIDFLFLYSHLN